MGVRRLPEPNVIAVVSIVLVFFAIGTLASYLPRHAPLAATVTLLVLAVVVGLAAVWRLVVSRVFARSTFAVVAKPALIAVATAAGFIEFAFLYDKTRGSSLAILTAGLIVIVIELPLLLAYSVARHEPEPVAGLSS
jgi:uncharacterized membrane protein